jgi:hypothetical protein
MERSTGNSSPGPPPIKSRLIYAHFWGVMGGIAGSLIGFTLWDMFGAFAGGAIGIVIFWTTARRFLRSRA